MAPATLPPDLFLFSEKNRAFVEGRAVRPLMGSSKYAAFLVIGLLFGVIGTMFVIIGLAIRASLPVLIGLPFALIGFFLLSRLPALSRQLRAGQVVFGAITGAERYTGTDSDGYSLDSLRVHFVFRSPVTQADIAGNTSVSSAHRASASFTRSARSRSPTPTTRISSRCSDDCRL